MSIQNIFNLHMDVSFNDKHILYENLTTQCTKNNIYFNKKIIIPINEYNRYDFSLYIMKDIFYYRNILLKPDILYEKKISDDILTLYNNNIIDVIKKDNCKFNDTLIHIIYKFNKRYIDLLKYKNINILIKWIYNRYLILYKWYKYFDVKIDINFILGLYYFLGTLEWFHIYILKLILKPNQIVIGDNLLFNCANLQVFTTPELHKFFINEYSSHSTLYLIGDSYITLYDPDYIKHSSDNKIYVLESLLDIKYYPLIIPVSIQEKIDDNYCIFHCIGIIEYIIKLNITFDDIGFNTLCNYINTLQITTNKSTIIHYINLIHTNLKFIY